MRLEADEDSQDFAEWLLDVGHGRHTEADCSMTLPDIMKTPNLESLISYIYPGIATQSPPPQYFSRRIILSARNIDVEDINLLVLSKMSGNKKTLLSADMVLGVNGEEDAESPIPVEFLRTMHAPGLPPGELRLKIGAPVILLRNLSPGTGLCNSTRATIVRMTDRVIEVRIMTGHHFGELALIPRITITPSDSQGEFSFTLRRRQFPLRLAFAMTINKAQGQSVDYVGVDLRVPVFSHGQLYVALSRATSSRRIWTLLPYDAVTAITKNIVYPEVLLD